MLAHLAADRALVADLDTKILDLERSLFALRTEKQLVQERLDSFKYLVLTLPNEITAEIFTHFLPPYPDCPPFAGPHSPTLFTQICHEWREIALGTPTLWRAMAPSDLSISFDRRVHLCETWLRRSRSCPLSLSLRFPPSDELGASNSVRTGPAPHALGISGSRPLCFVRSHHRGPNAPAPSFRSVRVQRAACRRYILPSAAAALTHTPRYNTSECRRPAGPIDLVDSERRIPLRICGDFAADMQPRPLRINCLIRLGGYQRSVARPRHRAPVLGVISPG
ncbi:hypothetical protein K438DRAFT_602863 [Mycena galopus ATCC 62051]|nr:hypothetical protein K438DRAFT_602863 [Mycena galopus ATCC 62051]